MIRTRRHSSASTRKLAARRRPRLLNGGVLQPPTLCGRRRRRRQQSQRPAGARAFLRAARYGPRPGPGPPSLSILLPRPALVLPRCLYCVVLFLRGANSAPLPSLSPTYTRRPGPSAGVLAHPHAADCDSSGFCERRPPPLPPRRSPAREKPKTARATASRNTTRAITPTPFLAWIDDQQLYTGVADPVVTLRIRLQADLDWVQY